MKIKEGGGMDIQKEREAFQKFCEENFDFENHEQTYFDEQTQCYENDVGEDTESINMAWMAWQAAKAQEHAKLKLLLCDEHLEKCESPTGIFNSQYPEEEPCLICLAKEAKAQAVPEGFVLVNAEQLSQWGHMANYAEKYGCPECFEARGYAHSLACEINDFFAIEAQEQK